MIIILANLDVAYLIGEEGQFNPIKYRKYLEIELYCNIFG